MTSLVTGGTGFIGAEVVRLLLKRGGIRLSSVETHPETWGVQKG